MRVPSRAILLSQLEAVFETKGYEGATLTQLAEATGLGKASLYHHFPGGKAEMAASLLRDAVSRLEQQAFSRLLGPQPAAERLARFVEGFADYTSNGTRNCLVAVFAQGSASEVHGDAIASQYDVWRKRLAGVYEEPGCRPRRAERDAATLLASLYGNLLMARLLADPDNFRRGLKRLRKTLPA